MITVKVKLYASLRQLAPQQDIGCPLPVDLPEPATLARLIEQLNLPETKIIFVNGITQNDHQFQLSADDEIAIFPLIGGG